MIRAVRGGQRPECPTCCPLPMLPEQLADWPDSVDRAAVLLFLALAFGLPLAGYAFFALDVRSYLRSLRRQLIRLSGAAPLPDWAAPKVPRCFEAFGLSPPCTEEELKAAYRERVKQMHPDLGGDRTRFLKLQKHFEESLAILHETNPPRERSEKKPTTKSPADPSRS
ncbi:MAG: J domain-containing protein [Pirellulales bacterium]|nr:J domain-containing protein [Pirellulales bacterium]